MKKTFFLISLLLCIFALDALAGRIPSEYITRGPYIQMTTTGSVTVIWRSSKRIEPKLLYIDPNGPMKEIAGKENFSIRTLFSPPPTHQRPSPKDGSRFVMEYEAPITSLSPNTTYYYAIYDGNKLLAGDHSSYYFKTHPTKESTTDLRIWALGDSGTGKKQARRVFNGMKKYTSKQQRLPDLFIHTGDMAYEDGTDPEFQTKFFNVYQEILKNTPVWLTLGNHEGHTSDSLKGIGPYYDTFVLPTQGEAGGIASETEAYYAFDYGRVHFIVLESYALDRTPTGEMAQWLEKDLYHIDTDWIIAYWHHPPYTKGSYNSDMDRRQTEMRTHIMPILEQGGVDLVLTGHSHIYERSMLINGATSTPTIVEGVILDDGPGNPYKKSKGIHPHHGTVCVVLGNGGAAMYRIGTMPIMRQTLVEYGSLIIDIKGPRLIARMIDRKGKIRDQFGITKEGDIKNIPIADSWKPIGPGFLPELNVFIHTCQIKIQSFAKWEDEEIRYTLDGTDPSTNAPLYTTPFTINKTRTIKTRVFSKDRKKISPVTTQTYTKYKRKLPEPIYIKIKPGLRVHVYTGKWNTLPDFKKLKPVAVKTVSNISTEVTHQKDYFGLKFSGFIKVPADGMYAFHLNSDSRSKLYIGNKEITNHIGLKKGLHPESVRQNLTIFHYLLG
ncbi:MAG: hypothetical protein GKR87_10620 [Kiritimatiellae bacterium]|nr:hypothetical protein [Kiritimatiellia bacterium]